MNKQRKHVKFLYRDDGATYELEDRLPKPGEYCIDNGDVFGPYEDGDELFHDQCYAIVATDDPLLIESGVKPLDTHSSHLVVPTAEQYEVKFVSLRPRAVILHALGGYSAGMEDKAAEMDKILNRFLIVNRLVIMPSIDGGLKFVPMEVALRSEENGK